VRIKDLAIAICATALLSGVQAKAAPLSTYGKLPTIEDVEISPDGTRLAVSLTDGEQRVLTIHNAADNKLIKALRMGNNKLRWVQWADASHLLVTVSSTANVVGLEGPKREYWMTSLYDLDTDKARLLLDNQPDSMNVVLSAASLRSVDGAPTAFVQGIHFVDNLGRNTLFAVNVKNGRTRMIEARSEDTDDWLVGGDGVPLAQSQYDQSRGTWVLRIKGPKGWTIVDRAVSPMGSYGVSGLGRDGKSVLVARVNDKNETVYREYAADGSQVDVPMEIPFDGLLRDPGNDALIGGVSLVGDKTRYVFFDPKDQSRWNAVEKGFAGSRVSLASWSADRSKVVVRVDSPTDGPAYALVDMTAKTASWIGDEYKDLAAADIAEVRPVKYKAADGLEITGYLTLPKGKDPKNLPLVVLPHGGPEGRDTPGFDWWAQGLASRGYAVLQPNFRGSEGFGWDFIKAGFGEWGRKMQTDLSDGVRWLEKQGIADPKRVCIVGASYGGYAALAGAALDRGVYRCAVSVAGPADLKRMLQDDQERHLSRNNSTLRYWLRFMGADGIRDPDLAAISPAKLTDKIDIPILLIHGKDDTVVPYVQSKIMADAMARAGKPTELVTLASEDHWLSRGASRQQMLNATVQFLEKHNPPDPAAPAQTTAAR